LNKPLGLDIIHFTTNKICTKNEQQPPKLDDCKFFYIQLDELYFKFNTLDE
jgi:hypothetical protein